MGETRNAIITGSTSGIGLAIARALAQIGSNVTINGFGPAEAIEKERSSIESEFAVRCLYSPADMSKPDQIASMVRETERVLGSVDILVNNAGVQFVSPIEDFPPEKWDQIIAIDLSAAFHAMRLVVPGMKRRKWGRIISTASMALARKRRASAFRDLPEDRCTRTPLCWNRTHQMFDSLRRYRQAIEVKNTPLGAHPGAQNT